MKNVVLLMLLAGCATVRPGTALVAPDVLTRGETIYFGSSFPLTGAADAPTFVYERKVEDLGEGAQRALHVTRNPAGEVQIAEEATHGPQYALRDYTLHTNQLGQSGSVHVAQDAVTFTLNGETKVERTTDPVAVGPTLVGFVFVRLEELRQGAVVPLRLAVLDRFETIGFELRSVAAAPGQTKVQMTASSFLYRLAIDPVFFTFETASAKLVRLEGRIPPKVKNGDGWANFDARVEYRFVADAYR